MMPEAVKSVAWYVMIKYALHLVSYLNFFFDLLLCQSIAVHEHCVLQLYPLFIYIFCLWAYIW